MSQCVTLINVVQQGPPGPAGPSAAYLATPATLTASQTIPADSNATMNGPVTVAAGATLTVLAGSTLRIL
jgi:hypothetical protein